MYERDWQKDWELCEKATLGPWATRITHNMSPSDSKVSSCEIVALEPGETYPSEKSYCIAKLVPYGAWAYGEFKEHVVRDAQFIAEARQALPYWLQWVRELEQERMELEEVLNKCLQYLRDECYEGCSDNPKECWVENCPVKKAVDLILGALNKEVENNA